MYSARTAARIAKVRPQHFQAWAKARLIHGKPARAGGHDETLYSYEDLLLLRLIRRLREEGFKAREIRVALDTIAELSEGDRNAWMRVTLYVKEGVIAVVFPERPDWNPLAVSKGAQKLAVVFFPQLVKELERELVPEPYEPFVEIRPDVLGGSPVIRGTRVSTRAVAEAREAGVEPGVAFPDLTEEQVSNAERYEQYLAAA